MDSFSPQEQERDRAQREYSFFDPPQYVISYNDDHTLRWDPPTKSKELSIALSYHFPLEEDLESKMQAATRKFLRDEQHQISESPQTSGTSGTSGTSENIKIDFDGLPMHMNPEEQATRLTVKVPGLPSSHIKPGPIASHRISMPETRTLQFLAWDADMKEFSPRIKKRRYDKEERVKVAANRGFACDRHRRQKMKCDPERCSRNKQRLSSLENMAAKAELQLTLDKRHSSFVPDPETTACHLGSSIDPTTFTMNSTPSSDPSPRWTVSSFVDPATLYKLEGFHMSAQSLDFPPPSLEYSSRSHDSIGSMLSTSSDLNFLAGYNEMSFDIPTYETYHLWGRNGPLEPADPTFNDLMPFDQSIARSNARLMEMFQIEDKQPSAFDQPSIKHPQEQLDWPDIIPQSYTIDPTSTPSFRPSSSPMESTMTTTDTQGHCQQDLMEWEAAHSSSVTQGYYPNTQEVKPLTEEEKRTLIKWWGRDRSSERPESIRGRQNSYESQPLNVDLAENEIQSAMGMGMGMGKKASLREKVKTATVHVAPFPRSLFRSRSAGKEKKP